MGALLMATGFGVHCARHNKAPHDLIVMGLGTYYATGSYNKEASLNPKA